jgi:RNA polymerase sigma-70 factor (ECF subfamily)
MDQKESLTGQFEQNRGRLRGLAYRMLGSLSEAEDAVQETWLRLNRSDVESVDNLAGWLTTVTGRVCLDMLRARKARREESVDEPRPDAQPLTVPASTPDPEQEAVLADSVGLALLVVLDTLAPAERLAFVLHDLFGVPFDDIAPIVQRSPDATRQLASRARRRVRGTGQVAPTDLAGQRDVVERFLQALRAGDLEGLIAVLDPDVLVRADAAVAPRPYEIRGASKWAKGAVTFGHLARHTVPAVIDGAVGLVLAPGGKLQRVLRLRVANGRIDEIDIIGDAGKLQSMEIAALE